MFTKLKNFSYLMIAALIGFSSCGGDDEEETPLPTITINTNSLGADQTKGNATTGTTVTINLSATATEEIAKINATKTVGGAGGSLSGYPITSGFTSKTTNTWNATYTVVETAGTTVVLTFSVEDKKGKSASKTFTITVGAPAATINAYTAVLMNNQEVSTGTAFYSVQDNVKYNLAQAKTNSSKVDFCHALRNSTAGGRLICAPQSEDATAIFDNGTAPDRLSTWAVRNATKFKSLALSLSQFDALTTATNITDATGAANTITETSVETLDNGSTFAFLLANGKRGIARVTGVTGPSVFDPAAANNEGSITISVKVEK